MLTEVEASKLSPISAQSVDATDGSMRGFDAGGSKLRYFISGLQYTRYGSFSLIASRNYGVFLAVLSSGRDIEDKAIRTCCPPPPPSPPNERQGVVRVWFKKSDVPDNPVDLEVKVNVSLSLRYIIVQDSTILALILSHQEHIPISNPAWPPTAPPTHPTPPSPPTTSDPPPPKKNHPKTPPSSTAPSSTNPTP